METSHSTESHSSDSYLSCDDFDESTSWCSFFSEEDFVLVATPAQQNKAAEDTASCETSESGISFTPLVLPSRIASCDDVILNLHATKVSSKLKTFCIWPKRRFSDVLPETKSAVDTFYEGDISSFHGAFLKDQTDRSISTAEDAAFKSISALDIRRKSYDSGSCGLSGVRRHVSQRSINFDPSYLSTPSDIAHRCYARRYSCPPEKTSVTKKKTLSHFSKMSIASTLDYLGIANTCQRLESTLEEAAGAHVSPRELPESSERPIVLSPAKTEPGHRTKTGQIYHPAHIWFEEDDDQIARSSDALSPELTSPVSYNQPSSNVCPNYETEELLRVIPRTDSGRLLSYGSIRHRDGTCRACIFSQNPSKTCQNGIRCLFCHYPHQIKKKCRASRRRRRRRQSRRFQGLGTEQQRFLLGPIQPGATITGFLDLEDGRRQRTPQFGPLLSLTEFDNSRSTVLPPSYVHTPYSEGLYQHPSSPQTLKDPAIDGTSQTVYPLSFSTAAFSQPVFPDSHMFLVSPPPPAPYMTYCQDTPYRLLRADTRGLVSMFDPPPPKCSVEFQSSFYARRQPWFPEYRCSNL